MKLILLLSGTLLVQCLEVDVIKLEGKNLKSTSMSFSPSKTLLNLGVSGLALEEPGPGPGV